MVLDSIDFNVSPCDDFYEFVCGNWKRRHVVPSSQSSYSHFTELQDKLEIALKDVLENNGNSTFKPTLDAIKVYKACLNVEQIESVGGKPLLDLLKEVIDGWPVLLGSQWNENNFDFPKALAKARALGITGIFNTYIGPDLKNNTYNVFNIDQTTLVLVREYYIDNTYFPYLQLYLSLHVNLIRALSTQELTDPQKTELLQLVEFERSLANITTSAASRLNITNGYNLMRVSEFKSRYKDVFDFNPYFTYLLPKERPLRDNEYIVVNDLPYLDKLGPLLKATPKRVLANYIGWYIALRFAWDLSSQFRNAQRIFISAITGSTAEPERWQSCVNFVNTNLPSAVGLLYVNRYFSEESKKEVEKVIAEIVPVFRNILIYSEFMDTQTRNQALYKLQNTLPMIGYDNSLKDPSTLEELHKDLVVFDNDHFQNVLNIQKTDFVESIALLDQKNNRSDWPVGSAVVNAFNNIGNNALVFPAAILQQPLFGADLPRAWTFGSTGAVIGHELTHGFDREGKQFGADGSLFNFWTEEANMNFLKKAECIRNQYGNITVPEVNITLNGDNTLSENIADNGGLREAFIAYERGKTKYGAYEDEEQYLPGLPFSHDQSFFVSFASIWCEIYRPEQLFSTVIADTHSPSKYRVNVPIMNLPDFLPIFHCPANSKMASKNICRVW